MARSGSRADEVAVEGAGARTCPWSRTGGVVVERGNEVRGDSEAAGAGGWGRARFGGEWRREGRRRARELVSWRRGSRIGGWWRGTRPRDEVAAQRPKCKRARGPPLHLGFLEPGWAGPGKAGWLALVAGCCWMGWARRVGVVRRLAGLVGLAGCLPPFFLTKMFFFLFIFCFL